MALAWNRRVRYIDRMPPRRKHPRRRVRRDRAAAPPPAPAPEPEPVRPRRDISWTGLAGGFTGAIPLGARAVEILADPKDLSRYWAIPLFAISAVYLTAVWASVAALSNRKRILRNILSVTLVLLVTATILTGDPGLAVLLMIPSSLLAIAAGVIFQGRGSQK